MPAPGGDRRVTIAALRALGSLASSAPQGHPARKIASLTVAEITTRLISGGCDELPAVQRAAVAVQISLDIGTDTEIGISACVKAACSDLSARVRAHIIWDALSFLRSSLQDPTCGMPSICTSLPALIDLHVAGLRSGANVCMAASALLNFCTDQMIGATRFRAEAKPWHNLSRTTEFAGIQVEAAVVSSAADHRTMDACEAMMGHCKNGIRVEKDNHTQDETLSQVCSVHEIQFEMTKKVDVNKALDDASNAVSDDTLGYGNEEKKMKTQQAIEKVTTAPKQQWQCKIQCQQPVQVQRPVSLHTLASSPIPVPESNGSKTLLKTVSLKKHPSSLKMPPENNLSHRGEVGLNDAQACEKKMDDRLELQTAYHAPPLPLGACCTQEEEVVQKKIKLVFRPKNQPSMDTSAANKSVPTLSGTALNLEQKSMTCIDTDARKRSLVEAKASTNAGFGENVAFALAPENKEKKLKKHRDETPDEKAARKAQKRGKGKRNAT